MSLYDAIFSSKRRSAKNDKLFDTVVERNHKWAVSVIYLFNLKTVHACLLNLKSNRSAYGFVYLNKKGQWSDDQLTLKHRPRLKMTVVCQTNSKQQTVVKTKMMMFNGLIRCSMFQTVLAFDDTVHAIVCITLLAYPDPHTTETSRYCTSFSCITMPD